MANQYHPTKLLLSKPVWTVADVMEWSGFKKDKATEIMKIAKAKGGAVALGSMYATTDSVLKLFGTSREVELSLLGDDR